MLLVCDGCGAERVRLGAIDYLPNPRLLVGHLAEVTARELGFGEDRVGRIRFAALVCAMGREQTPVELLDKREPLTDADWSELRRQPELAADALGPAAGLEDIREWVLAYRERPDGGGYPRGLTGAEIPDEARILAVVDAYMAMTGTRTYRPTRDHASACRELERCSPAQFHAGVVAAFVTASRGLDEPRALAA
jgi:HD-GYP domain-containing protein (c-di-GMP phosphodiesterase class II)